MEELSTGTKEHCYNGWSGLSTPSSHTGALSPQVMHDTWAWSTCPSPKTWSLGFRTHCNPRPWGALPCHGFKKAEGRGAPRLQEHNRGPALAFAEPISRRGS